jgi:hypothetical protein
MISKETTIVISYCASILMEPFLFKQSNLLWKFLFDNGESKYKCVLEQILYIVGYVTPLGSNGK